MFDMDRIMQTCHSVMALGAEADLRFKALPVIQWEFSSKSDFYRAEAELRRALTPMLIERVLAEHRERHRQGVAEFDCYGVTFRLICPAVALDYRKLSDGGSL